MDFTLSQGTREFRLSKQTLQITDTDMTTAGTASHIVQNEQGDCIAQVPQNCLLFPVFREL
jgi:hypothetical protein